MQHVQEWIQAGRNLEEEDDLAQVIIRRAHTRRMLTEDWSGNKTKLFQRLANKNPTPAGFLAEHTDRGMSSHPQEIHETIQNHWVKGIFRYYDDKPKPLWSDFLKEYEHLLGPKRCLTHSLLLPQCNFEIERSGEGVHMDLMAGGTKNYVYFLLEFGNY